MRLHHDLLYLHVLSHNLLPALADQMLVLHALLYSHLHQHMLAVLLAAVGRGSFAVPDSLAYEYRHTILGISI